MANNELRSAGNISPNITLIVAIVAAILALLGLFLPGGVERKVEDSVQVLRKATDQRMEELSKSVDQKLADIPETVKNIEDTVNKNLEAQVTRLEQRIAKLGEDSLARQTQNNENIRYHTQQLNDLMKSQQAVEARLAQAVEQAKATIVQQVNQEIKPLIAQTRGLGISDFRNQTHANLAYLTSQITSLSRLQSELQQSAKGYFTQTDKRLARVEEQSGGLIKDLASFQSRTHDNLVYQTQQLTALRTSQQNLETRLAQAIQYAKTMATQVEQDLATILTELKSLRDFQTRTNGNILYHTEQLNELKNSQRAAETRLAKAIDETQVMVTRLEQTFTPLIAQVKDLEDKQTRTDENILNHTKQIEELQASQRASEDRLVKLADQAKEAVQRVAEEIDDRIKAFSEKIDAQQTRTDENILYHTQKITGLENSQREHLAKIDKNFESARQQITSLKEEMGMRMEEMSDNLNVRILGVETDLKKEIDTHSAIVSKLKEEMDIRLAEANKSLGELRENLRSQQADINEKFSLINQQVTDLNEKLNLASQNLTNLKEGAEDRLGKIEVSLNTVNEQMASTRTDMDERTIEVNRGLQFINDELSNLRATTEELRAQLERVDNDLADMGERLRNVAKDAEEGARSRLAELEKDLDSFNRKVIDLAGFQDGIKARLADLGRDVSGLLQRMELSDFSKSRNELNALLTKATENLNTIDRQIGRFEEFNTLARSHFDRVNADLTTLNQQVASFNEFKETTKSHLVRIGDSLNQLNLQIVSFTEFREMARSRLAEVDTKLNSFLLSYQRFLGERAPLTAPAPNQ